MTIDSASELCRQAVTQLQEQTMSFVPKLVVMMLVMLLTLPWMLNQLVEYSTELFRNVVVG